MAYRIVVNREICHGCGNCVVACPVNANKSSEVAGGKGPQEDINPSIIIEDGAVKINQLDECTNCATCIKACPIGAIKVEEVE